MRNLESLRTRVPAYLVSWNNLTCFSSLSTLLSLSLLSCVISPFRFSSKISPDCRVTSRFSRYEGPSRPKRITKALHHEFFTNDLHRSFYLTTAAFKPRDKCPFADEKLENAGRWRAQDDDVNSVLVVGSFSAEGACSKRHPSRDPVKWLFCFIARQRILCASGRYLEGGLFRTGCSWRKSAGVNRYPSRLSFSLLLFFLIQVPRESGEVYSNLQEKKKKICPSLHTSANLHSVLPRGLLLQVSQNAGRYIRWGFRGDIAEKHGSFAQRISRDYLVRILGIGISGFPNLLVREIK